MRAVIVVHGGCGKRRPKPGRLEWIVAALRAGHEVLGRGGRALDAVQRAINVMELSGKFNAGAGAVKQEDGRRRRDAGLMDGRSLRAGGVAGSERSITPVDLARAVMEKTPHVFMYGKFAEKVAGRSPEVRRRLPRRARSAASTSGDTVGAIALDAKGSLAAGTSTGGAPPMRPGRIGDTPLVGCGLYADNSTGAVSTTGKGESIIRAALAKDICERMSRGAAPAAAARAALKRMRGRAGGVAGAIVLDRRGRIGLVHYGWMTAGVIGPGGQIAVKDRWGSV